MDRIIQIDGRTRIRRMDRMNVTVEKLQEVKTRSGEPVEKWTMANGQKYGPFCQSEGAACKWLFEQECLPDGFQGDLKTAVASWERKAAEIVAKVNEAVSAR